MAIFLKFSQQKCRKNGIDLGSNQALLLKKIEELTLILNKQNKRIEKLEKENQLKEAVDEKSIFL